MAKRNKLKFNKTTDDRRFETKTQTEKPKTMLMYPAGISDGCTAWRIDWVRAALNYNKIAQAHMTNIIQPVFHQTPKGKAINPIYIQSDTVLLQRPVFPQQVKLAQQFELTQKQLAKSGNEPFRFVIDVDDVLHGDHISKFNAARGGFEDNKRFEIFKEVVKYSDELQVCSPTMVEFYKDQLEFANVTHRPNLMPNYLFDVFYNEDVLRMRFEKHAKKPRIVWAGSATHVDINNQNKGVDDFSHIENFVKATLDEYQWVFMGATPIWLQEEAKQSKVEIHPWVSIMDYPRYLWNLEPTIIFAPLHDDVFNRCKSNIKLTEAGAMGIAGVFQDLEPYAEAPLKFKTAFELHDHIKYLLSSWDNYVTVSRKMRTISEGYLMDNNMELLKASYFTGINSRERQMMSRKLQEIQNNV